ncbi:transcriptional regulator, GntR family protein [Stigmatella aurantiaca DW4/3-1]|uniref:Transcriptional regulator, GntR family protein n=1 Tax=Stigmatella aurantiaca (strain DW4/3-1) TaxID=378806 RepID=Q090U5_STIAD|nr:transcriptional regulator, GntR family protein [Stigmatella aurantiaca DW4/3-1]
MVRSPPPVLPQTNGHPGSNSECTRLKCLKRPRSRRASVDGLRRRVLLAASSRRREGESPNRGKLPPPCQPQVVRWPCLKLRRGADMEWVGLVGRVEQDLERMMSQGLLPQDGLLPSENSLAKHYGLSRSTVREALKRLAARELIEQHPGRRSRALPWEGAVTLENLGVVLEGPGAAHPERRKLLEGLLALKRETAVELLAACCQQASARDLDTRAGLCFELAEAARWDDNPGRWAQWEFELLRQAARAVDRPGQALLLQSLERSYRGMARRLVPHLNAQATRQWALCALHALAAKDEQSLRRELPALLQASDAHLLASLPPPQEPRGSSRPPPCADTAPSHPTSEHEEAPERLPEATGPNQSACQTGLSQRAPTGGPPSEAPSSDLRTPLVEGAPGAEVPQDQEASRRVPLGLQERLSQALVGSGTGGEFLGRQSGHFLPVRPSLIPPLKPYFLLGVLCGSSVRRTTHPPVEVRRERESNAASRAGSGKPMARAAASDQSFSHPKRCGISGEGMFHGTWSAGSPGGNLRLKLRVLCLPSDIQPCLGGRGWPHFPLLRIGNPPTRKSNPQDLARFRSSRNAGI